MKCKFCKKNFTEDDFIIFLDLNRDENYMHYDCLLDFLDYWGYASVVEFDELPKMRGERNDF